MTIDSSSHLPLWLGGPIDELSANAGLPSDQIRLVVCLLAAVPLGWLHRAFPTPTLKHLYATIVGALFCWFVVGWTFLHVPLSAILVYILVQVVPRKYAPTVVFVVTVAWLSALHIFRVIYHYMAYDLDATMILMIWTVKASTFAYNVADGMALNSGEKLSERESTHLFRSDRALTKLPTLLEYFSYVFFFGGVLVGPCFEAKEYFDFVDGNLLKKHGLKSIPSSILPALKCVFLALVMYAGIFIYSMYPMFGVVETPEFGSWPFLTKFIYFWISITASRFKYYFAWYFGDAGCVATGFGFNGIVVHDGKIVGSKWDRVSNCDVLAVESAPHMSDVTNNWNMGVNNWLKNYVYFRVEAPRWVIKMGIPQKTFMNLVTKITSAFWHGFYPSYYMFFLGAWLAGEMDDALRASFEPVQSAHAKKDRAKSFWKGPTSLYECVSWVLCMTVLNFWGVTFVLLRADYAWQFGANMYFLGVTLPIAVILVCKLFFRPKRVKKTEIAPVIVGGKTVAASAVSPTAQIVSAVSISTDTPLAPVPRHDVVHSHPVVAEEPDESPADRVKSRPRRSRSNKAE